MLLVLASNAPLFLYSAIAGEPGSGLYVALAASLVFGVGGSIFVTSRLIRTLDRFRRTAERLAEGDLSARVYPARLAELAELSQSLNSMASRLQKRLELLTRSSAEQDAILRSMIEGVITVDGDGRIRRVNGAARQLLGIAVEECAGRLFQEIIHHAELQRFVAHSLRSPDSQSRVIMLPGYEERVLEVYSSPLKEDDTPASGTLLVFHDTTRVHKLEAVRRDFVANVSHELRTPITSIKGFVETLIDGAMNEPESLKKFLAIIAKHADRLNAIFSDLLMLAQLEARDEDEELGLEPCSVAEMSQAAVEACALRASERQARVFVEIDDSLRVLGKSNLLEQALVNLIDNAIKYSDPHSSVTVCAHEEQGLVKVSVIDSGPGIEKHHLDRLFERFYRVDQGRSRQMGGTGLGLSIVKHIMQVHRGRVEVQSTPGKGSTFSLFLNPSKEG